MVNGRLEDGDCTKNGCRMGCAAGIRQGDEVDDGGGGENKEIHILDCKGYASRSTERG